MGQQGTPLGALLSCSECIAIGLELAVGACLLAGTLAVRLSPLNPPALRARGNKSQDPDGLRVGREQPVPWLDQQRRAAATNLSWLARARGRRSEPCPPGIPVDPVRAAPDECARESGRHRWCLLCLSFRGPLPWATRREPEQLANWAAVAASSDRFPHDVTACWAILAQRELCSSSCVGPALTTRAPAPRLGCGLAS